MSEKPKPGDLFWWKDVRLTMRLVDMQSHSFSFELLETHECWPVGTPDDDPGKPEYILRDPDSVSDRYTEDPLNAKRIVSGFVKWDGCSHFDMQPDGGGYIHVCGFDDLERLSEGLARVFDFAKDHLDTFDVEIAGYEKRVSARPAYAAEGKP